MLLIFFLLMSICQAGLTTTTETVPEQEIIDGKVDIIIGIKDKYNLGYLSFDIMNRLLKRQLDEENISVTITSSEPCTSIVCKVALNYKKSDQDLQFSWAHLK